MHCPHVAVAAAAAAILPAVDSGSVFVEGAVVVERWAWVETAQMSTPKTMVMTHWHAIAAAAAKLTVIAMVVAAVVGWLEIGTAQTMHCPHVAVAAAAAILPAAAIVAVAAAANAKAVESVVVGAAHAMVMHWLPGAGSGAVFVEGAVVVGRFGQVQIVV
jgi:hypothetical protein